MAIPSSPTSATTTPSAVVGFDYDALGSNAATDLRDVAARIRGRMVASVIDTGRELLAVKQRLQHGQFEAWVEAECLITPRTAQNMMAAAQWAEGKSETISLMPPTVLYALSALSTPEDAQKDLLRRIEAGEKIKVDDAKRIIANARHTAQKAAKKALRRQPTLEQIADANKREARERKRVERAERERQAANERRRLAHSDLIKFLSERVSDDDWGRLISLVEAVRFIDAITLRNRGVDDQEAVELGIN
jgi:Protein of unknown function (DUF3102)